MPHHDAHESVFNRGQIGLRATLQAVVLSAVLGVVKIAAGVFGNSYALIADGMESMLDLVSAMVVWSGLRIAMKPPDDDHPYGHGKAESLAALAVSVFLIGGAGLIAAKSVQEIITPHHAPAPWTLLVLIGVIALKEGIYRFMLHRGKQIDSSALQADAWHHRADALTSLAAFIGISIAWIGGPGYEAADDWAALAACGVILWNGISIMRSAVNDVMDAAAPESLVTDMRAIAAAVPQVCDVEKLRIRKSGLGWLVDIHVEVDPELTVAASHVIAHDVKAALVLANRGIIDALVHIEPHEPPDAEA